MERIDQLCEEVSGMRAEMKQLSSAMAELAKTNARMEERDINRKAELQRVWTAIEAVRGLTTQNTTIIQAVETTVAILEHQTKSFKWLAGGIIMTVLGSALAVIYKFGMTP